MGCFVMGPRCACYGRCLVGFGGVHEPQLGGGGGLQLAPGVCLQWAHTPPLLSPVCPQPYIPTLQCFLLSSIHLLLPSPLSVLLPSHYPPPCCPSPHPPTHPSGHPSVVSLHEALEDECCVYFIMEVCAGGEGQGAGGGAGGEGG